jgi:poly-beta-hydroxyalkanoate depolymerase
VALFTVEGELDDISGAGQTQAAHDLCSGIPADMQQDFVAPGAGHYGIFSAAAGARWCARKSPSSSRSTADNMVLRPVQRGVLL